VFPARRRKRTLKIINDRETTAQVKCMVRLFAGQPPTVTWEVRPVWRRQAAIDPVGDLGVFGMGWHEDTVQHSEAAVATSRFAAVQRSVMSGLNDRKADTQGAGTLS
jgi:hypothetical protein